MKVLILGASGLIGGNLMRHLSQELNWNVVGTYFSYKAKDCLYFNTLDLNDSENFDVDSFGPEVIVHCGALTWVDYCEDHEEESYEKTVLSTKNALEIAARHKSTFIYLSTDYVFDGAKGPYREDDEVRPLSVYGRHKLEAEKLVESYEGKSIIGRVTNVYGDEERGKNFIARLVEMARSGKEEVMNFPIDQYATPVNAYDVGRALALLISNNKEGIYNIASTDFVNRYQLAKMVLKHFPDNKIICKSVTTAELNQKAERPLNGGLLTEKYLNEFPEFNFSNVDDYITGLNS